MKAALHKSEASRLKALKSYDVLDTPREAEFDEVVQLISTICETPISVINLIDDGRQWFKAEVGLGVRETPIDSSLCAHAILQPGLFIVPDTELDERFCDNPLVVGEPKLRFYAGALLETRDGLPIGTVCVLDYKPRTLSLVQKQLLSVMADQVMKTLELRKLVAHEHALRVKAEMIAEENKLLAREGDHRVMNSLQLVQSILTLQLRDAQSEEIKIILASARNRVLAIASVHRELHLGGSLENIEVGAFLRRIIDSLQQTAPANVTSIDLATDAMMLRSDLASAMGLLVAELVTNSFKYAYGGKLKGSIQIRFENDADGWSLQVLDFGRGLPVGFDVSNSTGVGMKVINALARRLDAALIATSENGKTMFEIQKRNRH